MMNSFSFSRIPELVFGAGKLSQLPGMLEKYGKHLLIVTGKSSFSATPQAALLFEKLVYMGFSWSVYPIVHEPSVDDIDNAVKQFGERLPDVIVAIGGGSVIDAGKAISAMLESTENTVHYLEGVGDIIPTGEKVPFVAVPTTAGTGSEATRNAVISKVGVNGYKSSLRHPNYIPDLALIDPELQLSCPERLTACSGMDAFSQLLESYLSTQANAMTDTLALDGIKHVHDSLIHIVCENQNDIILRSKMAYAAWLSGITLSNAGLGTIHGFAASIGAVAAIPHGTVCGTLMAEVNRATLERLSEIENEAYFLKKYATVGRIFSKENDRSDRYYAGFLIDYLYEMTEKLSIPRLSKYKISNGDLPKIAERTSNKNNPVKLTREEMVDVLERRM